MANHAVTPYKDRILRPNRERWPRVRNPPGWAQHRQDMTSAVPWFTTQQAGVSCTQLKDPGGHFVTGMLIGGYTGARSYMDAEVVITSINGTQGQSPTSGETQRRHEAMVNTINAQRLVGLIVERGSTLPQSQSRGKRPAANTTAPDVPPLFPCNNMPNDPATGQNCWVADYFLPVNIWPTRIPGSQDGRAWMVKLEKFNLEDQSWWANGRHGLPPRDHERDPTVVTRQETCPTCRVPSPRIYQEMFICLNNTCTDCWCKQGQIITEDEPLTYTVEFLQERQARPMPSVTRPELVEDFVQWWQTMYYGPMSRNEQITRQNLETWRSTLLRGFCCPYCAMLNRRVHWHEWHCRNTTCNAAAGSPFRIVGHPPVLTLQQVQDLGQRVPAPTFQTMHGYQRTRDLPLFTAHEYELGEGCNVAYLLPKPGTNSMPGGSDYLYGRMQELANSGAVPLERRGVSTAAGPLLTGHFAVNYGKLYYFSGRVGTIEWADKSIPPEILRARDLVNDWCSPFRTANEDPANELYIAGYWKDQHMGWHDDGERGLQDLITTYTLGGQGMFKLRIKPAYNYGRTTSSTGQTSKWIKHDPVIPGCVKETERRALKDRLDRKEITQEDWEEEFEKLMSVVSTAGSRGTGVSDRNVLLQFPVNHGCLVLMYGPNTQKYLHHCVTVDSPLRFALTFRHITDDHYANFDQQAHTKKLAYDIAYEPGEDWLNPRSPSPVGDGRARTPLPELMEEDGGPPPKRPRDDGDDDDEDAMQGVVATTPARAPTPSPAPAPAPAPAPSDTTQSTRGRRGTRARGATGAAGRRPRAGTRRSTRNTTATN